MYGPIRTPTDPNTGFDVTSQDNLTFVSSRAAYVFGAGIASGDFNNDGIDDVMIGYAEYVNIKYGPHQIKENYNLMVSEKRSCSIIIPKHIRQDNKR